MLTIKNNNKKKMNIHTSVSEIVYHFVGH